MRLTVKADYGIAVFSHPQLQALGIAVGIAFNFSHFRQCLVQFQSPIPSRHSTPLGKAWMVPHRDYLQTVVSNPHASIMPSVTLQSFML